MAKCVWSWCWVCQLGTLLLNWQDVNVQKAVRQNHVHVNVQIQIAQTPAVLMILKNTRIPIAVKNLKVGMQKNRKINLK